MKKYILGICLLITNTINAEINVLAFAGSTSSTSYNKMLVKLAGSMAEKSGAKVTYIDLKDFDMPFYDADLESTKGMPENAKKLRKLLMDSDAIIISTPEYNASVPAVLKNAIDWASRGEDGKPSRAGFIGKKFALMSASPGKGGGSIGLAHLSEIIESIGGAIIKPQVTVGTAHNAFDESGELRDEMLNTQLKIEIQHLIK